MNDNSLWFFLRYAGKAAQLVSLVLLVATALSVFLLFELSSGPRSLNLCQSSSKLPGRLHMYFCMERAYSMVNLESPKRHLLGVASSIRVIHLARRSDRFETMEQLRTFLNTEWIYEDALEKSEDLTESILESVRIQRSKATPFEWPVTSAASTELLLDDAESLFLNTNGSLPKISKDANNALLCATGDDDVPIFENGSAIPFYMMLSRGMIACWYSHLQALANSNSYSTPKISSGSWDGKDGVTIILEDDIDVESDIEERLKGMWSDLPSDWDMLFLGHCWSDESSKPPVSPSSAIHPATAPKCTHAYAVSPNGARRLLLHLTYPPFAFSRALDQAFAHLIVSGRIRAYSVVPSIVVQRRERNDSDIWESKEGSGWKESLDNSAFESINENANNIS